MCYVCDCVYIMYNIAYVLMICVLIPNVDVSLVYQSSILMQLYSNYFSTSTRVCSVLRKLH